MRNQAMVPPFGEGRESDTQQTKTGAAVDCGWGRLLFGQTFESAEALVETMRAEAPERRDIAVYVRDPHVVLSLAPQEMFLDPSHTYRLDLATYKTARRRPAPAGGGDHLVGPPDPAGAALLARSVRVGRAQVRSADATRARSGLSGRSVDGAHAIPRAATRVSPGVLAPVPGRALLHLISRVSEWPVTPCSR